MCNCNIHFLQNNFDLQPKKDTPSAFSAQDALLFEIGNFRVNIIAKNYAFSDGTVARRPGPHGYFSSW
jgi:hypothetical protein